MVLHPNIKMDSEEDINRRMDIVGNLPQEISLHILSFVTAADLFACSYVCKKWHRLASTDFLWKRHCISDFFLSEDENFPQCADEALRKWRPVYKSLQRKVNRWEKDCPTHNDVHLTSSNNVIAFGQVSFVVYYFIPLESQLEKLHVYRISGEHLYHEQIIELELPGRGVVQLVTNDIYTLVSRDNFVLCFKKTPKELIKYVGICLRSGMIKYSTEDLMSFIKSNHSLDRELNIRELSDDFLWLEDRNKYFYVFNLKNNTFIRIEPLQELKCMCNLVALWSNSSVIVYLPCGEVIRHLPIDFAQDVVLNKNILASLHADTGQHERLLQAYDISSGKKLMERNVMRFTDITIHSFYDSIYVLERSSHDLFRVSSICARSGLVQWKVSLPNIFYNLWPAALHVVSHKHLFVWPCNNKIDRYCVFNLKSGEMLYTSTKFPGNIQCVSEHLCISVDGQTVHIKSFL